MKTPKGAIIESGNAIARAGIIVGSKKILAEMISVSRELLHYYELNTLLPLDKAIAVYIATGGKVSIYELRPDLKGLIMKFVVLFVKREFENKCGWVFMQLRNIFC